MTLNRTIQELKLLNTKTHKVTRLTLNRTIQELKLIKPIIVTYKSTALNRTIQELKRRRESTRNTSTQSFKSNHSGIETGNNENLVNEELQTLNRTIQELKRW